jgi:DNA-binding beta-propeller fold protein YncE
MMDDELMEFDALRFEVSRRLALGADSGSGHGDHGAHHDPGADMARTMAKNMAENMAESMAKVEPSWVSPPTASGKVYVAALSGNEILEVDLESFTVIRRFATATGPYNLAVTPDESLLVVTYKKSDAVGFWDLATGTELARVPTTRRIPHGVAITGDGRYSFVTIEGVGGEPGLVEIFDNRSRERVGLIEVGKQAGGVAIWERPS